MNKGTEQRDLRISSPFEPFVTVDNIEVAQFIHLLPNNQEIRNVIDTITSKVVLILGRFADDRKVVLDHLRDELRKHNYLPIMFDFEPSAHRTTVETIKTLAGMARFVIVDLTDDYGPHRTPIFGRPSSSCCRRTPKGQAAESWRRWRNVIERATIFARGGALDFDLPLTGADLTPCRLEAADHEKNYLTYAAGDPV